MKILVGKTFGIGNLVMAIPMLKALRSLKPERLDLLIGNTPDDGGAHDVARQLFASGLIDSFYVNAADEFSYDYAIMSIPFDGRWRYNIHFTATQVIDGRT